MPCRRGCQHCCRNRGSRIRGRESALGSLGGIPRRNRSIVTNSWACCRPYRTRTVRFHRSYGPFSKSYHPSFVTAQILHAVHHAAEQASHPQSVRSKPYFRYREFRWGVHAGHATVWMATNVSTTLATVYPFLILARRYLSPVEVQNRSHLDSNLCCVHARIQRILTSRPPDITPHIPPPSRCPHVYGFLVFHRRC